MNLRYVLLALVVMIVSTAVISWRFGWSAHADHINALAAEKKQKIEKTFHQVEQKAAQASNEGRVIYKTINREVVKYVQKPNRTVCQFDDESVRLRQRAIDAANSIRGFDAAALQGK